MFALPGLASAAGPLTWSAAQNVDGTNTISSLECPSTTLCVAGDGNGNVITSADPGGGAAAWTVSNLVAGFVSMNDIACPSTTLCLAVDSNGSVWWSTDPNGGATKWTEEPGVFVGTGGLEEISCPATTLCVVSTGSGGFVYWSTNPTGAGSWTQVHIDGTNAEFSLDCPSTTLCVTGNDAGGINWTNNPTGIATDWTNVPGVGFGVLEGLSCVTETFCVGSDDSGNIVTSSNPTGAATAWTLTTFPFVTMWSIACPATTLCVTTAGTSSRSSVNPLGNTTADWSDDTLGTSLNAVSCASTAFCIAGGSSGNIYVGRQATLGVTLAGAGTGSVSGAGIGCPGTCSFVYPLNTGVTLTATPAADGSTFSGWSGDCTGTGDCVLSMASDRAVTATFAPAPPPPGPAPGSAPTPPPPVATPAAQLPPPVQNRTANAYPASGTVLVRPAGSQRFVPLTEPEQVRFGAVFDTRRGSVTLTITNRNGRLDTATFSEGQFRLVASSGVAELQLSGGSFRGCPKGAKGGASTAAAKRGRNVRHLWGSGSGSFRTKGRFASATVRGTKWLTDDYCLGTLVKVAAGAVTVRDLVERKTVALRARKTYFAAARA